MGALGRGGIFLFEGFRLDRNADALFRRRDDGTFVPMVLGSRAIEVLGVLIERPGDLVSRDAFMAAVWPATAVEDTNLNMQIAALRRILDAGQARSSCIQTIPGRGYRFTIPVTRVEPSAPLASGQPSGNGAGAPIAEQPKPKSPAVPCRSGNTQSTVPPRQLKWPWSGSLAMAAGALCLLAIVAAASNWHPSRFGAAVPAPRLSIVVLPFTNLGDDRDAHDLANGLTEDLSTDLSLVPDFLVTSRRTALSYANKLVDTKQIGRELGVRYVLEGSVQRSGNELRINAQLIDAETDTQLWAERFDRDTADLPGLQNEITNRIAVALNAAMLNTEASRSTDHPDALGYILRGRAVRLRPDSRDVFAEAIDLFEHALALDPQSVEAQTWLAGTLAGRVLDGLTHSAAADIARSERLIDRVLAAKPDYTLAHFIKGNVLRAQERCEHAVPEYERALALSSNFVMALNGLAWCRCWAGSLDEVIPLEEEVIRLSPSDPHIGWRYLAIGLVDILQSRAEEAIVVLEKARAAVPAAPVAHSRLASAYALTGDTDRAGSELAEARKLAEDDRYSSIARLRGSGWGVSKTRSLFEATLFAGLRKAGMPEE
jgi:adenylate cyclase